MNDDWCIHQFRTCIISELPRLIRPYEEIHVVSLLNVLVILNWSMILFSGVCILVAKKIVILLYNWKIVSFVPSSLYSLLYAYYSFVFNYHYIVKYT